MIVLESRPVYQNRIESSIENFPITFLIGPRQAGKSSLLHLLQKQHPSSLYYSFDGQVDFPIFKKTEELLNFLTLKTGGKAKDFPLLILDEAQNIPHLEIFLKDLADNYPQKVVLAGSGSLKIYRKIRESLVGRENSIFIYPLNFAEFLSWKSKQDLSEFWRYFHSGVNGEVSSVLEEYLRFGGYPKVTLITSANEKLAYLRSLYHKWILIDIRGLLRGEELIYFDKVFRSLAGRVTSHLILEHILQKLKLSRSTVKKLIDILTNTFLLFTLPSYSERLASEIKARQKVYFYDLGLLNFLSGNFELASQKGQLEENFVVKSLLTTAPEHFRLYFWQKRNQTEIDLVAKNILTNKLIPIEIKSKATSTIPRAFRGFDQQYSAQIEKFVVFNKDNKEDREFIKGKKVHFIPSMFAPIFWKILENAA